MKSTAPDDMADLLSMFYFFCLFLFIKKFFIVV